MQPHKLAEDLYNLSPVGGLYLPPQNNDTVQSDRFGVFKTCRVSVYPDTVTCNITHKFESENTPLMLTAALEMRFGDAVKLEGTDRGSKIRLLLPDVWKERPTAQRATFMVAWLREFIAIIHPILTGDMGR